MSWRELASRVEERGGQEWIDVPVHAWRDVHRLLRDDGKVRLEHLTAFDDRGVRLVSTLSGALGDGIVHVTCGPSDEFDAIDDVFPSARWHQREIAQMLGAAFAGAQDTRPAFEDAFSGHPLRRDHVLTPRVERPWPGAFEPDEAARRRPTPAPGVTQEWTR